VVYYREVLCRLHHHTQLFFVAMLEACARSFKLLPFFFHIEDMLPRRRRQAEEAATFLHQASMPSKQRNRYREMSPHLDRLQKHPQMPKPP